MGVPTDGRNHKQNLFPSARCDDRRCYHRDRFPVHSLGGRTLSDSRPSQLTPIKFVLPTGKVPHSRRRKTGVREVWVVTSTVRTPRPDFVLEVFQEGWDSGSYRTPWETPEE